MTPLETAWKSSQFARTAPVPHPAHTKLLLQPSCSIVATHYHRVKAQLECTYLKWINRLRPASASDQGSTPLPVWMFLYTLQRMWKTNSRAKTATAKTYSSYTSGRGEEQLSSVVYNPFDQDTRPLTKACMQGEKWNQPRVATPNPQALKPQPYTRPGHGNYLGLEYGREAQLPQVFLNQPLAPNSICDKAVMAIEHKRSLDLHLALVLNSLTPALPHQGDCQHTPGKMQPVLLRSSSVNKATGTSRLPV